MKDIVDRFAAAFIVLLLGFWAPPAWAGRPTRATASLSAPDVLIIGLASRLSELTQLANAATACGITPYIDTLEEIRLCWPDDPDTLAIQKDVAFWFEGTNLANKSVVVLGSWSRGSEFPEYDEIPTRYVYVGELRGGDGLSATDQLYGDVDFDGHWDVPVWRVLTRNATETAMFCSKVTAYHDAGPNQEWTRHIELHCDDRDYGRASPYRARELSLALASLVGGEFVCDGVIQSSQHPTAWNQLVLDGALDDGKAVIIAGPSATSNSHKWLCFTYPGFTFAIPHAPSWPLMLGFSCDLGGFDQYWTNDSYVPLARDWFQVGFWSTGPIGWIGPTCGSYQYVNYWVLEQLIPLLTVHGCTFGQALLIATRQVAFFHPEAYEGLIVYQGLGVPWLKLHRATGDPTGVADSSGLYPVEMLISPNPVHAGQVVHIEITSRGPAVGRSAVFGPDGRVVRSFVPVGTSFDWDLRDTHGRTVSSGVYYVLVPTADRKYARSVVVVR